MKSKKFNIANMTREEALAYGRRSVWMNTLSLSHKLDFENMSEIQIHIDLLVSTFLGVLISGISKSKLYSDLKNQLSGLINDTMEMVNCNFEEKH